MSLNIRRSRKRVRPFEDLISRISFWDNTPGRDYHCTQTHTVYYVALMNYHPSSYIYVTFKHFLVGIVLGR